MVKHFTERNEPKYGELLKIKERLPDLVASVGVADIGKILMAEITKFVESYTIVRPMSADQIAQCAFAIISTSEEDMLSMQDLVLFFEGAKQGKYGRVLDHIDQHVIFEMLDKYREARHHIYLNLKEERDIQFKGLGPSDRSSDEFEDKENDIRAEMVRHYGEHTIKNAGSE